MIIIIIMHHHKLSVVLNILTPRMVKMEWKTNKDKQIHKGSAENVHKNEPGL